MQYKYKIQAKTFKGIFSIEIETDKVLTLLDAQGIVAIELEKENPFLRIQEVRFKQI